MNRDIEFRGYDTDNKCWRYGYYFCKEDVTLNAIYNSKEQWKKDQKANKHHLILWNGFSDWGLPKPHYQSEVDRESVGQFTGLYDKNNKKIYEGDILNVIYSDFKGDPIYHKIAIRDMTCYEFLAKLNWANELEIVGNIYEEESKEETINE